MRVSFDIPDTHFLPAGHVLKIEDYQAAGLRLPPTPFYVIKGEDGLWFVDVPDA